MRTAIAIAIALPLAAAGCRKPSTPATSGSRTFDWSQVSTDGKFEIVLKREASGCRTQLLARPSGNRVWESKECLPAPSGLVFLSPSGDQLLALDLFPASTTAGSDDWSKVPIISLWTRGGVSRQYTAGEVLAGDRVKQMSTVLSWLRGESYDELRRSARAIAGGTQVSVDLVDGRTILLGFEGTALPQPPAVSPRAAVAERKEAPAAPRGPAEAPPADGTTVRIARQDQVDMESDERMYRWEDDHRSLHFTPGSQVPAKYRKHASLVQGHVDVVERPPPDLGKAAQPGQQGATAGQPGAAAAPAGAAPAAPPPAAPPAAAPPAAAPGT